MLDGDGAMSEFKMGPYEQYIALSRYARFLEEEGRRETWPETVRRYFDFWRNRKVLDEKTLAELEESVVNMEVMPSMRGLMTAGSALDRDHIAGYNCSYLAINRIRAFDELMYILLCGTGVGFSVEHQYVSKLPEVADEFYDTETTIHVRDSKIGWAKALRELIGLLYTGQVPSWDISKIRPAGAPLKTFGGRASGPEPLDKLFRNVTSIFKGSRGRQLSPLECHDICCHIANAIVVGGVRRSALISLSDLSDKDMATSKSGGWYIEHPHRNLANNSAVYDNKPSIGVFLDEWRNLYTSRSGERGIFNREAAKRKVESLERRDANFDFGTNPCSEIILRDRQFC